MFWFALCHLLSCLVDLFTVRSMTGAQKDIQILLLRQQVRVLQRKAYQPKRFSRLEKTLLAVLVAKLRRTTSDFCAQVHPVLIFSPDTVLRWHREWVRRKWTFRRKAAAGRPRIAPELEALVLELARENAGWGYDHVEGELVKLPYGGGKVMLEYASGVLGMMHLGAWGGYSSATERYSLIGDHGAIIVDNTTRLSWHRGIPFAYSRTISFVPLGSDRGGGVGSAKSLGDIRE